MVTQHVPSLKVFTVNMFRVEYEAYGAPHVRHGVLGRVDVSGLEFLEALHQVRGDPALDVVGSAPEILLNGEEQVVADHPLDDVVGRANDIVVLVSLLDFGEHRLVNIKGLVDDLDLLSGLFLVPLLEILDEAFFHVVTPVVDLQDVLPVRGATGDHKRRREDAE